MLEDLFRLFRSRGFQLYIVGGFVRDKLLGLEPRDLDLATDAVPETVKAVLSDGGYRTWSPGERFGTVAAMDNSHREFQITTFRCDEQYSGGSRHPEVSFGRDLKKDLIRRDFTVNAMAMDEEGNVIDPLGGRKDLAARLIRTPMEPGLTFRQDPLRMLRAFRFACRLNFSIDPRTLRAVEENASLLREISRERWKMEMDALLSAEDGSSVAETLESMRMTGILRVMLPELETVFLLNGLPQGPAHFGDIWQHTLAVVQFTPSPDPLLRWAALLHDSGKPFRRRIDADGSVHFRGHETAAEKPVRAVAQRFRFSGDQRDTLLFLVKNHMRPVLYNSEWSDRALRRLRSDAGKNLDLLLDLAEADIRAHSPEYRQRGMKSLEELRCRLHLLPDRSGKRLLPAELGFMLRDLVGRQLSSCREIGTVLNNLEELVLDGILPPMEAPELYLDYLRDHPEIRRSDDDQCGE